MTGFTEPFKIKIIILISANPVVAVNSSFALLFLFDFALNISFYSSALLCTKIKKIEKNSDG
jgi:hypothetical protein